MQVLLEMDRYDVQDSLCMGEMNMFLRSPYPNLGEYCLSDLLKAVCMLEQM